MKSPFFEKKVFAWALYDWANSAFATTVMVAFFPVFFKQTLAIGVPATASTVWLGNANGISSLVLALTAPWLGALADKGGAHIRMLAIFTAIGVLPTALLAFVGTSDAFTGLTLFVVASMGFWGGLIFYDSMLIRVAPPGHVDSVSGFGYSLGYLGGGLLLIVNVLMYQKPQWFGLASADQAIRASFVTVAVWWLVFAIPLLRQRRALATGPAIGLGRAAREGFAELLRTFREVRRFRPVILFLLAYWMYIDGVNTIMKMAVDYGLALGFPASSLITSILMIQFIGFPMTLLFGWFGDRISPLLGIFVAIIVYTAVTFYAVRMTNVSEFYIMGAAIGCVQGAVQAMSRSYYSRLIPADRASEFFGFYNMMGKFASVLGPFLMAATAAITGNSRTAILSVAILFVGGAVMLTFQARSTRVAPAAAQEPA
jgi:UMF1 family MFS transporter